VILPREPNGDRQNKLKIIVTFQLNARNLTEKGGLRPVGAFPDGTPNAYRIVGAKRGQAKLV